MKSKRLVLTYMIGPQTKTVFFKTREEMLYFLSSLRELETMLTVIDICEIEVTDETENK